MPGVWDNYYGMVQAYVDDMMERDEAFFMSPMPGPAEVQRIRAKRQEYSALLNAARRGPRRKR